MAAIKIVDLGIEAPLEGEASKVVGVASSLDAAGVIAAVQSLGVRHIVQRDGLAFGTEMNVAETMLRDPKAFFDHPLEIILGLRAKKSGSAFYMSYSASEKKTALLTNFGDFVARVKGSRRIWDQALLISDELYTNASKNAWGPSAKLFEGAPVYEGKIEFFAEATEERLVFGVRDSFGALDINDVISRIAVCFKNGVGESIRYGTPGAGIGSFMIFDACASYYAGVERGKMSVVFVSLPLGLSRKSASGLSKNIHLLP